MSCSTEIKKYILESCHLNLVGFAPASALKDEPHGHRPTDILPGAKSLIVFGRRIADGAIQAAFRQVEDGNAPARSGYTAYGSDIAPNFILFFDTFNIAQFIERNYGKTAMPLPCGPQQNSIPGAGPKPYFAGPVKSGLPMDIDKAAMAAGLGEFGWSNRFLTAEYGPRVQFGCVITTLELAYDEPYQGPRLCLGEACQKCVQMCPVNAISSCFEIHDTKAVEGKSTDVAKVNFNRCVIAACGLKKEFGSGKDLVTSTDPTDEEITEAFKNKPLSLAGIDHYPKSNCDKCLLYCPAGGWKERFSDTGLSQQ